ncbi:MAG TPA: 2-oxoacid:acceptor oxidoreductase family protein [Magnetospirillaceae bacterium]|nr:2-oxoacid:acceptor oxidoreductase family protein [Magnetospirillaceae bacterium]
MTEKSFMAGFGGQGIISMGQLWVYFGMKEGLHVTMFPFYGAEKRGGIARAGCIVSTSEIASPLVTYPDSAVVMNEDSLPLCEGIVKQGGVLLINSSLVRTETRRKDCTVYRVPCNEIAESIGDVKIANMVMMGSLSKVTGAVKLEKIEAVLAGFFPPSKHRFIGMNEKAIEAGKEAV